MEFIDGIYERIEVHGLDVLALFASLAMLRGRQGMTTSS
jgi:hypothetical protein